MIDLAPLPLSLPFGSPVTPGQTVVVSYRGTQWFGIAAVYEGEGRFLLLLQQGETKLMPAVVHQHNVRDVRLIDGEFTVRAGHESDPLFPPIVGQPHSAGLVVDGNGEPWIRGEDEHSVYWVCLSTGHAAQLHQLSGIQGFEHWSLWRATPAGRERIGLA